MPVCGPLAISKLQRRPGPYWLGSTGSTPKNFPWYDPGGTEPLLKVSFMMIPLGASEFTRREVVGMLGIEHA